MASRLPRRASYLLTASCALAAAGALGVSGTEARPARQSEPGIYLPLAVRRFGGPFPTAGSDSTSAPTQAPSVTPEATASQPSPGATLGTPTPTGSVSPTADPGATPSQPVPPVEHPTDPDTIILQMGWTDTTQVSQVFEEMNGTPWFTLYGDGRLIAGTSLFNILQPLNEGRVSGEVVQGWMRRLVRDVGFYEMASDYHHPRLSTPEVHVYALTVDGAKRVSLRSFKQFEQWGIPEEIPEAESVAALIDLVRDIEAELLAGAVPPSAAPFAPDCYTVLSQQMYGYEDVASQFDTWDHGLNVRAIAVAAPTAASNYIGKVVGHKFVDGDLGREIQAVVRPQWDFWFSSQNMAAAFRVGPLPYAVGARQEVPGGSLFLPSGGFDDRGAFWYRRDPGSGGCSSLPRQVAAPASIDVTDWSRQPAPSGAAADVARRLGAMLVGPWRRAPALRGG